MMPIGSENAQANAGTLTGRVMAGKHPVAGATVMIIEGDVPHTDLAAMTGETGKFMLGDLSPGHYRLEIRLGEQVLRRGVTVGAGETVELEIALPTS